MNKPDGISKEEFFKELDKLVELDKKAKKYSLSRDVLALLKDEPFFACVSRFVTKRRTTQIPTAAIYIDKKTFRPVMIYNPRFMVSLPMEQRKGIIKHEYYHLILNHITQNRMDFNKKNQKLWNVAMDLAINSFLMEELPDFALFPTKGMFKDMPAEKSSEWYKQAILNDEDVLEQLGLDENGEPKPCPNCGGSGNVSSDEDGEQQGQGNGGEEGQEGQSQGGHSHGDSDQECDCDSGQCSHNPGEGGGGGGNVKPCPCCNNHGIDDHSLWDDLSEEERNIVEKKMRRVLSDAVHEAKRQNNSKGWGTVSVHVQGYLEKLLKNSLNWKGILRMFVQASIKAERYSTIKKVNKRYPWLHPGKARRRTANIAVAIDQSGSVGNVLLTKFFAELNALSKIVTFTVIPFDHEVFEEKVYKWQKGQKFEPHRVLCGGTDFSAPTRYANENGPFDGLIMLTDMEAPEPIPARMQRIWVTSESCARSMYYKPTSERVLVIPDE